MADEHKKTRLKSRLRREITNYLFIFAYLAVFFVAFEWYKRLILAQYDITYLHYGIMITKALVLAKIVMLGDAIGLGRKLEEKPLIYPTFYKTFIFSIWVALFTVLEHVVFGLFHDVSPSRSIDEFFKQGIDGLVANWIVVFTVFIPFFGFRELSRVLGEEKIVQLYIGSRNHK